jgi:hypothetical protein
MLKYLFNATLNGAFLFIRLLRLGGRLLYILMLEWYALFLGNVKSWHLVYEDGAYSL